MGGNVMPMIEELGEMPDNYFNYKVITTYGEKCLVTSRDKSIVNSDEYLDGVVGWPEKNKEDIQVGRLTYSFGPGDFNQILDNKLKRLLNIESCNNYRDAKKSIADPESDTVCELGRLNNIRVSTKHRGKGVAKNLVNCMLRELSNYVIFLHIDSDTRDAAQQLYKSTGFIQFREDPNYMVYIPANNKHYDNLKEKLKL